MLLALSAGTFATVTAEMLPAGLLPEMSAGLGVGEAAIGSLVTLWAITIAVASIPLVRLVSRWERKTLLWSSLGVVAVANLLIATASSYELIAIFRVAAAAAHGVFWSLVAAHVGAMVCERKLAKGLAVVMAGPTLAGILGIPVGTALGQFVGWRGAFIAIAVVLGLVALAVALLVPRAPAVSGSGGSLARTPMGVLVPMVAAGAVLLVGHFAMYTYVAPLIASAGFGSAMVGPVLAVFGIAGAGGLALAGPLQERWRGGSAPVVFAIFFVAIALMLTVTLAQPVAFVAFAVWGFAMGVFVPVFQGAVLRAAGPAGHTFAGAALTVGFNLGIATGSGLGGVLYPRWGSGAMPVLALAAAGTALIAVLVLHARRPPGGGRPDVKNEEPTATTPGAEGAAPAPAKDPADAPASSPCSTS